MERPHQFARSLAPAGVPLGSLPQSEIPAVASPFHGRVGLLLPSGVGGVARRAAPATQHHRSQNDQNEDRQDDQKDLHGFSMPR